MLDATPDPSYESYSPTLQPFGGSDDEPERLIPFGFTPPQEAALPDWWDDCGVVD